LKKSTRPRPWLPVVNQGATYLGLAMIALVWLGFDFHMKSELATVQQDAIQHASNLSRAFEEHLVATLSDVDHTLQVVRNAFQRDPEKFDLTEWANQEHPLSDPAFQIVLIGPDGFMRSTTADPHPGPLDLSDREHFRVHIDAPDDKLFISKPLVGRVTQRKTIQLSRRISALDGSFAGVVVISVDPDHFTTFYNSIDIGREGTVRVVGTDGILRAIGSAKSERLAYVGSNLAGSTLLAQALIKPAGWYKTKSGRSDGVDRLVFYRVLQGFPLVVAVGLGAKELFAAVNAKRSYYNVVASGLTLLIMIVIGLSLRDRTRLERASKQLRSQNVRFAHMASHDGLTGLPNRAFLLESLNEWIERGSQFSVFMLDLDGFKLVNDTLGHGAGDSLLRAVSVRLRFLLRHDDIVARLGGDEFAILQRPLIDQGRDATALAADLIETLSEPYDLGGREISISTSIGIAIAPSQGRTSEEILGNADLALYQSKLSGRDRYCVFEPSMETRSRLRRDLQSDLRQALQKNEFELHYQPIFNIATQRCIGMEALLRWRRGSQGLVPPDEFIAIAEETGLISPIGEWVLCTACRDAKSWPHYISLAVNLSSAQFGKGDLSKAVSGALAATGFPAARLELEITESILLGRTESNVRLLRDLKEFGAKIVLDDFGTGYSSLTYLSSFAFDKVKIDRSFISAMIDRPDCAVIVNSIINLARSLEMKVVAEGVETEEQLIALRAAGCSQAQGNLFSRPRPADQLAEFYKQLRAVS